MLITYYYYWQFDKCETLRVNDSNLAKVKQWDPYRWKKCNIFQHRGTVHRNQLTWSSVCTSWSVDISHCPWQAPEPGSRWGWQSGAGEWQISRIWKHPGKGSNKSAIKTSVLPAFVQPGLWALPVEEKTDRSSNTLCNICAHKVWKAKSQKLNAHNSAVQGGRLEGPSWALQETQLCFSLFLNLWNLPLIMLTNSRENWWLPAGQREPRTWAAGCRGTTP